MYSFRCSSCELCARISSSRSWGVSWCSGLDGLKPAGIDSPPGISTVEVDVDGELARGLNREVSGGGSRPACRAWSTCFS